MKPTPEQIKAEIKALSKCREYIPKKTAFGDDNIRVIHLQIQELRDGIDDTCAEFEDMTEREQDAVYEARNWKCGDEPDSPSSGWGQYKPKAKK